jgi:hypothetical protein
LWTNEKLGDMNSLGSFDLNTISPKLEKLNGWAERWSCLGYKFKSYVEQNRVMMELADMNGLGPFDLSIISVQVGFTLY